MSNPGESRKMPNFILGVGAQKAGTTWLYSYLASHPQCAMGPRKEMCFFTDPSMAKHTPNPMNDRTRRLRRALQLSRKKQPNPHRDAQIAGLLEALLIRYQPERYAEAYARIVANNPDCRVIGDITPDYSILHQKDVDQMKRHLDGLGYPVKVVFLMRDPVSRCFSAAKMREKNLREMNGVGRRNQSIEDFSGSEFLKFSIGIECSSRTRYERTIAALEKSFDRSQIFYSIYEEFFKPSEIERLCDFLGLDYVEPDFNTRVNTSSSNKKPDPEKTAKVRAFYADTYEFCRERFGREKIDRLWSP